MTDSSIEAVDEEMAAQDTQGTHRTNPLFLPWHIENDFTIIDCAECEVAHIDTGDVAHDELIAKCIVALVNRVYKMPNQGVEP